MTAKNKDEVAWVLYQRALAKWILTGKLNGKRATIGERFEAASRNGALVT